MTVTRRLAATLAADCDEISETGLLVARRDCAQPPTLCQQQRADYPETSPIDANDPKAT